MGLEESIELWHMEIGKERGIPGGADTGARRHFAGKIAALPIWEMTGEFGGVCWHQSLERWVKARPGYRWPLWRRCQQSPACLLLVLGTHPVYTPYPFSRLDMAMWLNSNLWKRGRSYLPEKRSRPHGWVEGKFLQLYNPFLTCQLPPSPPPSWPPPSWLPLSILRTRVLSTHVVPGVVTSILTFFLI